MRHFLIEIEVQQLQVVVQVILRYWCIAHSKEWKGEGKLNFYSEVELNQPIDVTDRNPCCDFALQA